MNIDELCRALRRPAVARPVAQRQFDGNQKALERLSRAEVGSRLRAGDLCDYALDLSYVAPLDPILMRRALPLCLGQWRLLLLADKESAFTEQFAAALAKRPGVIESAIGAKAAAVTQRFMAEALLERMSAERSLAFRGQDASPYVWIGNLVQHGRNGPDVRRILRPWRAMKTPGLAVCAVQYLSVLAYGDQENPVFSPWTRARGGGPPCLWEGASVGFGESWGPDNRKALGGLLVGAKAARWSRDAAEKLRDRPEYAVAVRVADDLGRRPDRVKARVRDLLRFLGTPSESALWSWSSGE